MHLRIDIQWREFEGEETQEWLKDDIDMINIDNPHANMLSCLKEAEKLEDFYQSWTQKDKWERVYFLFVVMLWLKLSKFRQFVGSKEEKKDRHACTKIQTGKTIVLLILFLIAFLVMLWLQLCNFIQFCLVNRPKKWQT